MIQHPENALVDATPGLNPNDSHVHLESDELGYDNGEPSDLDISHAERETTLAEELIGAWHGMVLPVVESVVVGAPNCQRCEVLPRPLTEAGTLGLRFPHTHTLGKVLSFLIKGGWKHKQNNGLIDVQIPAGTLPTLLSPMMELLSSPEARDARAIFHFEGEIPRPNDYFEVESLPDFVEQVRSAWLLEILREKKIHSVFQPIVTCKEAGQSPQIHGYECLMRGEFQGNVVAPNTMIEMARAADLLFQLDLAARRSALIGAGGHKIQQKVFINFSPNSIYDPAHCLRSTVNTVEEVGLKREQVVFEITETARLPEMDHLQRIVNFYREEGFGVALDDVGAGYSSLNVLVALRPEYVKLDMMLTQNVHNDAGKAIVTQKLIETVRELGLLVVAEGIEQTEEWDWIRAQGADLAQGYLFSRPNTPPPLLNAT